jgi:hypothetical protein
MSWLFSQVLVEEYLGDTSLDGEQSVQLSGNPIQQAYCAPDKMTDFSHLSRFGMTYKPLTDDLGEALLMSYLAAFHAKTSLPQEKEQGFKESEAECGEKWRGWLAKYDPSSCSWRTAQCSLLEDLNECLETLPRSGMTRDGLLWELPMLAHHTRETESGLEEKWPTPRSCSAMAATITPESAWNDKRFPNLETVVGRRMFTTPTAHMAKETNAPSEHNRNTPTLTAQVNWPTPRTKGMCGGTGSWELLKKNTTIEEARQMGAGNGGKLNPMWVEWLMGWPLGFTDLKPLETDKFQKWQDEHGRC